MNIITFALTAAVLVTAIYGQDASAAVGQFRARGANGVVAAGTYNGNSYVRARGAQTNSDGSTTTASAGAFKLNNGAYGARGSTTTYGTDGSVTHSGQAAAYGAKGSATTSGGFTKNADGTYSGSHNTSITSSATGETYTGSTSYSNGSVSHTGTCHDASGNQVACP